MPYPAINSHRLAYDIDGTEMGESGNATSAIHTWYNSTKKSNFNNKGTVNQEGPYWGITPVYYWFFPLKFLISGINVEGGYSAVLEGSNDTTNGVDGTWETAIFSENLFYVQSIDNWRKNIKSASFSSSYKTIRLTVDIPRGYALYNIHLYGAKDPTERPDDIIFCNVSGDPLTALMDFEDRPEGSTLIKTCKLKNTSTDKIANNVTIGLGHSDFSLSFSQSGPWTANLSIASMGPGSLSNTIYVKNQLNPPNLTLGPQAARIITTTESWT